MSEQRSTPDVPAKGVAAAPDADGTAAAAAVSEPVAAAVTQPVAAAVTQPVARVSAAAPPAQPIPGAAPGAPGGGGWQPPPPVALPAAPGVRHGGLRPSWPLVAGAAALAAILAVLLTAVAAGVFFHERAYFAGRDGRGSVSASAGRNWQNGGGMPNPMRQWMRGGTNQAPQGTPGPGTGTVSRGYLGASVGDTARGANPAGAEVRAIQPGSPAEKAGLAVGDVITAVDGTKVADVSGLMQVLANTQPGTTLNLKVSRDGQSKRIPVTTVSADSL